MNRFELWDKVARNWQYRWQQPFRSVVALWLTPYKIMHMWNSSHIPGTIKILDLSNLKHDVSKWKRTLRV